MAVEFRDSDSKPCGSTEFAKSLLSANLQNLDAQLAKQVVAETNWRKNYQHYFYELAKIEATNPRANWGSFAAAFAGSVVNEAGQSLTDLAERGFANRTPIEFATIAGTAVRKFIDLPAAAAGLDQRHATADALRALDFIRANRHLNISSDILVALAGNAELAATKAWLDWGGTVAVIARRNDAAHERLIEHAINSAGTLHFIAGGVDLVDDIESCAHFIRTLSQHGKRLVIASYGYAGGVAQLKLQAAQIALIQVALQLPKSQIALSWLATPLDVIVTGVENAQQQIADYRSRSFTTKLRDKFWQLFGGLQACEPEVISGESDFAIFDASANLQGSSYLLAKHSERWLAMQAARMGVRVSFTVAPPARTESVLGAKKILARTYRGLKRFGVEPLEAKDTATIMAALLVRTLHDPAAPQPTGLPADYSLTAIHGGLWSLGYRVDSIWVAASILG